MNTKNFFRSKLSVAVSLALATTSAFAATTPDIGNALRQAQPPVVPAQAPALPQLGGAQQKIEAPMSALPSGPKVEVKQIEIVGNRVIDTKTLNALVADGVGKSMTLTELEMLAQRITRHYRANGYFVARAYIPAQEVTSGTIKIRVVEGNFGKFQLKNQSLVHNNILQGILDDVKHYDIVSLDTLERAMLIINDTPGVQVIRADVMPGEKVGTSDFAVDTAATPRYNGYIMADNYGSVYTGKNRLSFNVDDNSISGHGDRLSVSGLDTAGGGLVNERVAYSLPLAANGLREEVAYSQTQYQLGDTYAPLNALGTAKGFDALTTYPIRRIRAQIIEASLDLSHKNLDDKVQSTSTDTPKSSTSAIAGLSIRDERTLWSFDGITQASAKITYGQLNINDPTALASDAAGAQTQGNYSKLNIDLSRVSLLPKSFSLTTALKVQQSLMNKNLDGSERMAVSGSGGVMAYPSGELIGSDATFARAELAHSLPNLGKLQSNWLVFADWGNAHQQNLLPTDVNRNINDVGLGWTGTYGSALLRAHLAHRLSSDAVSEPTPNNNLLVQVIFGFDTPAAKYKAEPDHVEAPKAQVVAAQTQVETHTAPVAAAVAKVEPAPVAVAGVTEHTDAPAQLTTEIFMRGSARILQGTAKRLAEVVKYAQAHPTESIEVDGYADRRPNAKGEYTSKPSSAKFNLKLSLKRAETVKAYLVKMGVDAKRITTKGLGYEHPVASNASAEGRAKNRRAEIRIEAR